MTHPRSILATTAVVLLLAAPGPLHARAGAPANPATAEDTHRAASATPAPAGAEQPPALATPLAASLPAAAPATAGTAAGYETASPAVSTEPPAAAGPITAPGAAAPAGSDPAPEHPARPGLPDAEALARAYRRTGAAPSVERPTDSLFPFGHVRPVLRCAPLRACAVELEAGELVLATSLGDSERWLLQAASSGPGGRTPILVVKPIACDLSTNLVVSTDRRIYELALDSPPCRNADTGEATYNPRLQYTGLARFYYPDDLVRRWTGQEALAREQAERLAAGRTPLGAGARLAHLNFDYAWDRARRWPWVPAQVFDDGEHTYIALPPGARLAELPLLFALGPHDELSLLNYQLAGRTLVADRVLERAALVVGSAKKKDEQRLEIRNRAFGSLGAGSSGGVPTGAAGAAGAAGAMSTPGDDGQRP